MPTDRRTFLATLGSATLAAAAYRRLPGVERRLERIGLQLYTLRDEMKRDLPGTIARVAKIGYKEVEFAGYFGRTPEEIRDLLARHGLTSPSSHIGVPAPGPEWDRALREAKTIGNRWATVPWIPEEARKTLADWRAHAKHFNEAARAARDAGLRFAYHNHWFEFEKVEGTVPYDLLLAETDPALVDFEMDLYWITKAGADPLAYLTKHPGRFPLLHVKDATPAPQRDMAPVGQGTIDFARIFAKAGAKHYFVEHDNPKDPWASVSESYRYLEKLEF